jgi:ELWxxDGT repeat protein
MEKLIRNWFSGRRKLRRRHGTQIPHSAGLVEKLEDRSLLSAANPVISMNGIAPTMLPSVNGKQLLGLVHGDATHLYTTDGTQAGTVEFTDMPAALTLTSDGTFRDFAIRGSELFFSATGTAGRELWKTNGTAAGTQLVLDISSGSADSSPAEFSLFNGFVYFAATTAGSGRELWRTNGLALGTSLVVDVVPGLNSSNPAKMVAFDNQLFFATLADNDVYRTDGTAPGTTLVVSGNFSHDRLPDVGTYPIAVVNGRLIIKREDTSTGIDLLAYASATASPVVIKNVYLSQPNGIQGLDAFVVSGGNLYFRWRSYFLMDWHPMITSGSLMMTDGTAEGTTTVNNTLFRMRFPVEEAISFPYIVSVSNGVETLVFRDSASAGSGVTYFVNGALLTAIPTGQSQKPFTSEFVQLGTELFDLRESGLLKISSDLLSSAQIPATDPNVDGTAHDLRLMLGSLWFATPQALWKYDAAAPARVAGPAILSPGTYVGPEAGQSVPSEITIDWNPVLNAQSYDVEVSWPTGSTGYRSVTATEFTIPYQGLGNYTARVRAVLTNGQLSEVSAKSFTVVAVAQNLTFVRELPLEEKFEFSITDSDFTQYAVVRIVDNISGQVIIASLPVTIPAGAGERKAIISLPKNLLQLRRNLALKVSMSGDPAAPAAVINFDVQYKSLAVTMTGSSATISWTAPEGATAYDLWVDDEINKVSQYIRNQNLVAPSFTTTLPAGTYRAWVRAKLPSGVLTNWSNSIAFTTGGTMRVSNPAGTLNEGLGDETIVWSQVKNAIGYELWVNNSSNTRVLHQPGLGASATSYLAPLDFTPGTYTAWVRPKFSGNTFGAWSPARSFTIKARPISISFVDGAATEKFSWSSVRTAIGYELWVSNASGVQLIRQSNLPSTSTSFTYDGLLDDGTISVWVRAKLPDNTMGSWSPVHKFTILPRAIVITSGIGQVFDKTPTISWEAASYANSYEVWIARKGETSAIYHRRNLPAVQPNHTVDTALAEGEYDVFVRAHGSNKSSRWGSAGYLLVGFGTSNATPWLIAGSRTLTWTAIPGAVRYDLWVDYLGTAQPAQNQIIRDSTLTTNTYVMPAALPAGNFRAWVRAIHVENGTTFTSIWSIYAGTFKLS